jgi:hypothetical protein
VSKSFSLIVTDTSPLFTLVLGDALDALLRPGLPVRIPDAVYIEATRVHGAPGADQSSPGSITTWTRCGSFRPISASISNGVSNKVGRSVGRNVERRREAREDATTRERLGEQLVQRRDAPG